MPIHEQDLEIISEIIITLNKFDLEEKVCDYESWFNKWSINWTWWLGRFCHLAPDDYESDLGKTAVSVQRFLLNSKNYSLQSVLW